MLEVEVIRAVDDLRDFAEVLRCEEKGPVCYIFAKFLGRPCLFEAKTGEEGLTVVGDYLWVIPTDTVDLLLRPIAIQLGQRHAKRLVCQQCEDAEKVARYNDVFLAVLCDDCHEELAALSTQCPEGNFEAFKEEQEPEQQHKKQRNATTKFARQHGFRYTKRRKTCK